MNILGTHYKANGSCVINAEIDEVERQFLVEYALTKIIEEYIEELSKEDEVKKVAFDSYGMLPGC